ncbi:hypothetical protein BX666DRAFT_1896440 [Dichotomocladium elegans]|nr:hypothetical protein BX666DRAFT_1896440 [Dichotomocladium elegans]
MPPSSLVKHTLRPKVWTASMVLVWVQKGRACTSTMAAPILAPPAILCPHFKHRCQSAHSQSFSPFAFNFTLLFIHHKRFFLRLYCVGTSRDLIAITFIFRIKITNYLRQPVRKPGSSCCPKNANAQIRSNDTKPCA